MALLIFIAVMASIVAVLLTVLICKMSQAKKSGKKYELTAIETNRVMTQSDNRVVQPSVEAV